MAVVLALAVLLWLSIRRVPQGNECVVERAGRYRRTLNAGTHFLMPLLDRTGPLIDIRETPLNMRTLKVVTRDEIEVEVALLCFVQITDAARATYEVRDVRTAVEELVGVQVANHLAACPLGQLVADRERALLELPDRLDRATDVWGIKVTRLDIKDVRPPAQLLQAILDETRHEHEQRTRLLEAQAARNLELEELQRAHQVQLQKTQQEHEQTQAAENAAMALALTQQAAAAQAARLESETAAQAARLESETAAQAVRMQLDAEARSQLLAQESAALQLAAARNKAELDAELARIASEEARAREVIAQAEQTARTALEWRQSIDLAQRQREETAQQHRRIEQEAAHAHELARMAGERAAHEVRLQHALELERASAERAAELAAIAHEEFLTADRLRAERTRQEHAFAAAQDALEQTRTLEVARIDVEREKNERQLAARVRIAELAATEAAQLARAREVAAEADARSVQLLSASLQGVNAATLSYLAAREQSDALRSLGSSSLNSAAAGAAASLVASVTATRPGLATGESVDHASGAAEETPARHS